jgi:small-conductance mechanosensitive channel/CRP-like cAMP-binding protein
LKNFLEFVDRMEHEGGVGVVTAVVLIVLTLLFAAPNRKARIRPAIYLLLAHLAIFGISRLFDGDSSARRILDLAANFFLLASIGRGLFVLLTGVVFRHAADRFPQIFLDILHALIYIGAFVYILREGGADPISLVTGSALLTAIIGLSLRDTLGNLFAGLALQAQRPFDVGDWIQWDDEVEHTGKVVEINWRATRVLTLDAVEISIPHSTLGQASIMNYTKPARWTRRSIRFHAPADVPPQTVRKLVLEAVAGSFGVLDDPAPSVVTHDFVDSGVQYWLRFFTADFGERDRVDGEVRDRIWYAFHRAGVAMPAPQRHIAMEDVSRQGKELKRQDQVAARKAVLHGVDFLAELEDATLEHLAEMSRIALYAPGELILRTGEPGDEMFILRDGEVAILIEGPDRKTVEIGRLGPGQFFGEMSLLAGEPRSATVRATRPCELLVIGKDAFGRILQESPTLAERVSQIVTHRNMTSQRVKQNEQATEPRDSEEESVARLLKRIKKFFSI